MKINHCQVELSNPYRTENVEVCMHKNPIES